MARPRPTGRRFCRPNSIPGSRSPRMARSRCFSAKSMGGQGTDLAMAMIVADEMDVPLPKVKVIQGDNGLDRQSRRCVG